MIELYREQILKAVGLLSIEELVVLYQLIGLLQRNTLSVPARPRSQAYLQTRKALSTCRMPFSADILAHREERI